jgi:chaperonin GroEL
MKTKFSLFENLNKNLQTLEKIKNSVEITLGPIGRTGILATKKDEIQILTSGSFLIKSLEFEEEDQNTLLKLIRQASIKTSTLSGDGSTTTILFTCELLVQASRFLVNNYNIIFISNGLKKIAYFIMEKINLYSLPLSNYNHLVGILKTSLGKKVNPEFINLLSTSLSQIGRDGLILVEENIDSKNEIEIVQGFELEKGFASSYFVNDLNNFEVNYENPYILITTDPILSLTQIEHIIEFIKENNRPLVIIAEEINKEIVSTLVLNTIKKKIKVVVIKYSSIKFLKTGILEDLALLTHSTCYSAKTQQRKLDINDLGQTEKVIIKKEKSTFLINKFSKIIAKRRINELTRELILSETEYEKNLCQKRIARLSGNIAKIKIGFLNKYQIEEDRKKIETAIQLLKSSLEEGIVVGGGSFFLELKDEIKNWSYLNLIGDEFYASQLVINMLNLPFQLLLANFSEINIRKEQILKEVAYPKTYNILTSKIENGLESGLLDASKTIRSILWNALTLVATIISAE